MNGNEPKEKKLKENEKRNFTAKEKYRTVKMSAIENSANEKKSQTIKDKN